MSLGFRVLGLGYRPCFRGLGVLGCFGWRLEISGDFGDSGLSLDFVGFRVRGFGKLN